MYRVGELEMISLTKFACPSDRSVNRVIILVNLRVCRLECLHRHRASASARGLDEMTLKLDNIIRVVYRQGRSTIFRMPIYPMLNQCQ